ncbi:dTDP-4-dehydrorhamnose reductase [Limnohabitans sp.]|uniref:dTDP-4-dehydrorhamnose reductase n=1 Tax=Limnohabitans sp. TaxID=1907725 RepID=UPI0038B9CAA8
MTAHKILLLGANGQLGHELTTALQALGEVKALTRTEADMSHPDALRQSLAILVPGFVPTVVVNAAAYTAVDKAESDPETAHAVNAASVAVLGEVAQQCGAMVLHYSTDYVFDGSGHRPWQEIDAPHPMSVYGQSKWAGERALAQACARHVVLRTSWVVGAHGGNFLKTMLRLAAERDSLRVVADQVGVPTSTALLAQVTVRIIQALQRVDAHDARWGTYHVAAGGETTWHGYAQHVVAGALARGANLKATPEAVHPITTAEYPLPAPRPLNSRLDTRKVQQTFGLALPDWQQGVDVILDQLFAK